MPALKLRGTCWGPHKLHHTSSWAYSLALLPCLPASSHTKQPQGTQTATRVTSRWGGRGWAAGRQRYRASPAPPCLVTPGLGGGSGLHAQAGRALRWAGLQPAAVPPGGGAGVAGGARRRRVARSACAPGVACHAAVAHARLAPAPLTQPCLRATTSRASSRASPPTLTGQRGCPGCLALPPCRRLTLLRQQQWGPHRSLPPPAATAAGPREGPPPAACRRHGDPDAGGLTSGEKSAVRAAMLLLSTHIQRCTPCAVPGPHW